MTWMCCSGAAQTAYRIRGHVEDASGHPVAEAQVSTTSQQRKIDVRSGADGSFVLEWPGASGKLTVQATTRSMDSGAIEVDASESSDLLLVVHSSAVSQQVTVTATRSSLETFAPANTVYVLSAPALQDYPAVALDDKLRQQAGFELFRRSTSHVQNPTSQGISLRGLGSTAASRSLVLADSVPMNDAFGGWIHWDEIPTDVIETVTIATGGGSDLYGSSALGGVIDIVPSHPSTRRLDASAEAGGQDTSSYTVRGDEVVGRWSQLLATDLFRTAGYTVTAPEAAGPVDVPANVHDQAGRSESDRTYGAASRVFLVGNVLNEARGNGTPLQTNATRLWRYILGNDWTRGAAASGRARLFGSEEGYRQSFSSINTARSLETLTSLQHVRTQERGASTDATFSFSPMALVLGADVRDIRGTDNEVKISGGAQSALTDTSARQRFIGGFGELLASHKGWSGAASLRLDEAANLDTRIDTLPSSTLQPVATMNRSEFIPSPRVGVVRQLPWDVALHASVFRAFRTPTMNELYRTGQVGAQVTQSNPQLESERATGWEIGAARSAPGSAIALEGTYFWTEINRPVSAVLLSPNLYRRENLGQIVSQGTELHLTFRPERMVSGVVSYQYAHAVVTRFSAQPSLIGNWIPEVPRQSFTAQLRAQQPRWGEVTLAARAEGQAFDDSANTFVLSRFFLLDLSARHDFRGHVSATVMMQNLLDQRPQVAKTPILTLGSPFLAQGGVVFHWNQRSH